jgi:hypothetical protein
VSSLNIDDEIIRSDIGISKPSNCAYEMLPKPHRDCCLRKVKDNHTIQGTVSGVNDKELDGDYTFQVKATDGKTYHCEIVCHHTSITTLPFKKGIQCITPPYSAWAKPTLPKNGQHVSVTGTHTIDVREGSKDEIHPVCKVTVL